VLVFGAFVVFLCFCFLFTGLVFAILLVMVSLAVRVPCYAYCPGVKLWSALTLVGGPVVPVVRYLVWRTERS